MSTAAKTLGAGQAEEDEGADHPGVHRADPARREREQVGDHADEEALDDDPERDVDVEGVEARPEDRRCWPPRSRSRRATARPPRDGSRTKAIAVRVPLASVAGHAGETAREPREAVALR